MSGEYIREVVRCAHCGEDDPVHAIGCPVLDKQVNAAVRSISSDGRAALLEEAGKLIDGQRAKDYGDAHSNFQRIAVGWSEILEAPVTPAQVALCMDWLKTCRLITSPGHRDSWVDKAGYVALGGEIALT